MLLRTLAGSRVGQVEDYTYEAGRRAVAAGFAEPLEAASVPPVPVAAVAVTASPESTSRRPRRTRT